ncbi:MAG TPA: protein arginine kinase [Chitinispirillaceae bacterium]|nr:protein arginine kinase [Chitinispirillaceae bacterium]
MRADVITSEGNPGKLPAWFDNSGPDKDVITSTRVRLARNLAGHRFPCRASDSEKKKIFNEIVDVISREPRFRSFDICHLANMNNLGKLFLVEERIVSPDMLNESGERGVALDSTRRINIMINEEDHLRMQCLDSGFRPTELWSVVSHIDDILGRKLEFAFDSRRGFLTCCPTNSGTGLRVSFLMHLPGLVLTKAIDAVLQGASQMGISTRGFFGEHSEVVGNFFQLSNQATMGAHENDFLNNTQKIVCEIIKHERSARERIMRDAELELSDKIYRAYGILLHARTLTLSECLNLTSSLRLGVICGIFNNITIEELNRITMLSMPAHIQMFFNKAMDDREMTKIRADMVRELLTKRRRKRKSPGPDSNPSS